MRMTPPTGAAWWGRRRTYPPALDRDETEAERDDACEPSVMLAAVPAHFGEMQESGGGHRGVAVQFDDGPPLSDWRIVTCPLRYERPGC